jgi:hypothetical protein
VPPPRIVETLDVIEHIGHGLSSLAVRLAFSREVDAAEADAFRVLVVEDFDGVAVEDGDDRAGKVRINYKLGR